MEEAMEPREKRPRGRNLTDEERLKAQAAFLAEYAKRGTITHACRKAGISFETYYGWQEHDEQFALMFNQAKVAYNDTLRAEINRRAVEGVLKPVFFQGKLAGHIREFSDTLLIVQAKARMAEYREKQTIEHTGPDGGPMKHEHDFDYDAFAAAFAGLQHGDGLVAAASPEESLDIAHPDR